jgi:hypothetical protein
VQLSIFDMQGNEVISFNKINVSSNTSINISNLASGNYLLNIMQASTNLNKHLHG